MEQRNELLCGIPALILGAPSERVFFYVHGKMGSKEEALDFAAVADAHGWQVVSIDLPEHGARKDLPEPFTPTQIIPELQGVYQVLRSRWKTVGLYATSMGAWFSMQALPGEELERCLFAGGGSVSAHRKDHGVERRDLGTAGTGRESDSGQWRILLLAGVCRCQSPSYHPLGTSYHHLLWGIGSFDRPGHHSDFCRAIPL